MTRRISVLLAVLVAGATFVLTRSEEPVEADAKVPPIEVIAKRVEQLRGLKFDGLPKVRRITSDELQKESEEKVDRLGAQERKKARSQQDLLALLGFSSREATPSDLGNTDGILGVYDPPTKTLTIVTDVQGSRAQKELTIAHELTHALDDQAFGLPSINGGGDDAASARRSLVEGSARFTEMQYARRYFNEGVSAKDLASRLPASTVRGEINYFLNSDRFAYLDGARYIARITREGGQEARDQAFRNPPKATADILHPTPDSDARAPVALDVGSVAKGFQRVEQGQFGEFDTSQLLVLGALVGDDTRLQAAKGGAGLEAGRYELWRAGSKSLKGCSKPCVERDLLAIGWRFTDAEQARQFADRLPAYLEEFQELEPTGGGWKGEVAAAAVRQDGRRVTLALAPALALARLVTARA